MEDFDKKLSEKIRQELGNHSPAFDPKHWAAMEKRLANRRRVLWLRKGMLAAAILLCLGVSVPLMQNYLRYNGQSAEKMAKPGKPEGKKTQDAIVKVVPQGIGLPAGDYAHAPRRPFMRRYEAEKLRRNDRKKPVFLPHKDLSVNFSEKDTKQGEDKHRLALGSAAVSSSDTKKTNPKQGNLAVDTSFGEKMLAKALPAHLPASALLASQQILLDRSGYLPLTDSLLFSAPEFVVPPQISSAPAVVGPTVRLEVGILGGVSMLSTPNHKSAAPLLAANLDAYLHKRLFFRLKTGFQQHSLQTSRSIYVPTVIPKSMPGLETFSALPASDYLARPLVYRLPVLTFSTLLGYHFYSSNRLHIYATLGAAHYLWGGVTATPVQTTPYEITQIQYRLNIAKSLESEAIAPKKTESYPAMRYFDPFAALDLAFGLQYRLARRWKVTAAICATQALKPLSPVAIKPNYRSFSVGTAFLISSRD